MTAPATSETVEIAYPGAGPLRLSLAVGACRLAGKPGGAEPWVAGSYADPSGALPYKVVGEGGSVRITQEARVAEMLGLFKGAPAFDLRLGTGRPFDQVPCFVSEGGRVLGQELDLHPVSGEVGRAVGIKVLSKAQAFEMTRQVEDLALERTRDKDVEIVGLQWVLFHREVFLIEKKAPAPDQCQSRFPGLFFGELSQDREKGVDEVGRLIRPFS